MKRSTPGSVKFVWKSLNLTTYSIRLLQKLRLKIVSETNGDLHIRRTKLINKDLYDDEYLASFERTLITGLIQLIGWTFDLTHEWKINLYRLGFLISCLFYAFIHRLLAESHKYWLDYVVRPRAKHRQFFIILSLVKLMILVKHSLPKMRLHL